MENISQHILPETPEFKLHDNKNIIIGTFLGGPLAGAFLMSENFKNLNQQHFVVKTWAIAIAGLLVLIASAYIPIIEKIPNIFFSFLSIMIVSFFVNKYQADYMQEHVTQKGLFYSRWRAVGFGIMGLAVTLVCIFVILYCVYGNTLFEN
jgi:hypothetical protein